MAYQNVKVPEGGAKISIKDGKLQVPDNPIIPFVEGDGTGRDIWRASVRVFDAAVEKAYGGKRKIHWMEVYAGEKSFRMFQSWLPEETTEAFKEFLVGIKGPLTTPIGGGIRSLNVALRKILDLYVCQRPVRWYKGVPSPVLHPEYVDMVIFRENTEDIYAGIEFANGTEDNKKFKELFKEAFPKEYAKMRFPDTAGIGFKPVSQEGTERLVRAAIQWSLDNNRKSVNFVHKGNIMKFTEGAFKDWGYALAKREFRDRIVTERESWILGNKEKDANLSVEDNAKMIDPGFDMMSPAQQGDIKAEVEEALKLWDTHGDGKWKKMLLIKDSIADVSLQFTHHPPARLRCDRHDEPERRLPLRCAGGAGGRDRHCAGREHQLCDGSRHLRSDPRHRAEIRRPGQGQPRFGHSLGRDDVPLHGLDRSRRPDRQGHGRRHRGEDRHL